MITYSHQEHVKAFPDLKLDQRQRLGVEPSGRPLHDDGIEGPRTRSGIFISPMAAHKLLWQMIYFSLLGAREEGGNNKGRWPGYFMGERLLRDLTPAQIAALPAEEVERWSRIQQGAHCAGGASTAIRLAYGEGQPESQGARELVRLWSRKPGREVSLEDADAGDLISWRREVEGQKAAGHVGVVAGQARGLLLVMENNGSRRGGAVGLYGYSLSNAARRGDDEPQDVLRIARRADTGGAT